MTQQSFKNLIALIKSDMYRYCRSFSNKEFLKLLIQERGFVATTVVRITRYFYLNGPKPVYILFKIFNRCLQERYTCEIPHTFGIGPGFQVYHLYGLIIQHTATLGKNLNLSHYMTIGAKPSGKNAGAPTILDNVYVASGAKIIGGITIGNHVAVGANCVVTKDVPDYAVVVGIPGKSISDVGSVDYVINTDYEDKIPNLPLTRDAW
jgi:serine O-acetyltransferase